MIAMCGTQVRGVRLQGHLKPKARGVGEMRNHRPLALTVIRRQLNGSAHGKISARRRNEKEARPECRRRRGEVPTPDRAGRADHSGPVWDERHKKDEAPEHEGGPAWRVRMRECDDLQDER